MINFDEYTNENKKEHNLNWPYIPDHPYIILIGGSGTGKTNALLNLINNQQDTDKIYLHVKDPYEDKYQYLINKRESVGLKHFNDPKAFIEYSNDMHSVYKNINNYNLNKENKILINFDMIADMINNKKLNSIVNIQELFIRGRKLNISFIFITQSYFKVPNDVRNNSTRFFIMKIPNKRELQQIAINHSSDINTKDFIEIYRKCTDKPYSFLVTETTLPSNNSLRFRKNLNITNDDYQRSN